MPFKKELMTGATIALALATAAVIAPTPAPAQAAIVEAPFPRTNSRADALVQTPFPRTNAHRPGARTDYSF